MFTGRHSQCLKGKSLSSKQGSQSFVLRGQQLQKSNATNLKSSNSFSFCSCTCRCHQCCGQLADSLNLQLQDLQEKYDELQLFIKNKLEQENSKQENSKQENSKQENSKEENRKEEEESNKELENSNLITTDADLENAELKNRLEVQEQTIKLHQNCTNLINEFSTKARELSEKIKILEKELAENKSSHLVEVSNLQENLNMALQKQVDDTDSKYKELEAKYKREIEELKAKHNSDLKAKDRVISILKGDLAKSFDSNAKERKEQIDDLLRQVKRVSAEAEEAQLALMELKQQKEQEQDVCSHCASLQKEVQILRQRIQGKDDAIQDLNVICGKMKNQLVFQEEINDLLRKSKEWNR